MKTPDEIKKGLGCVLAGFNDSCSLVCATCEFYNPGYNIKKRMEDTLDYIQQLEASYQQVSKALCGKENATLEEVLQAVSQVKAELAAVKRERDAAVFALHGNCDECCWKDTAKCASCVYGIDAWNTHDDCWEWDGVCLENTEVQEGDH